LKRATESPSVEWVDPKGHHLCFAVPFSRFQRDFQAALLHAPWPQKFKEHPLTKAVYAEPSLNLLLFNGFTLSLGMSCGVVNKTLEGGRASYNGRESSSLSLHGERQARTINVT
jgi:hypothetical protein